MCEMRQRNGWHQAQNADGDRLAHKLLRTQMVDHAREGDGERDQDQVIVNRDVGNRRNQFTGTHEEREVDQEEEDESHGAALTDEGGRMKDENLRTEDRGWRIR